MRALSSLRPGLLAVCVAAGVPALAQSPALPGVLVDVRADPAAAAEVNEVLARYAQPATTAVPEEEDLAAYLKRACGGVEVTVIDSDPALRGLRRVRHQPCVRIEGPRVVQVEDGLTLSDIAVRYGLRADRVATFKIEAGPLNRGRVVTAQTLKPGDAVTIPARPLWTSVRLRPEDTLGAAGLISAIADILHCRGEVQSCLTANGVSVLERSQSAAPSSSPSAALGAAILEDRPVPAHAWLTSGILPTARVDLVANIAEEAQSGPPPSPSPVVYAAAREVAIAPPAPASAARTDLIVVPVDPDQWPFDRALVAELLRRSAPARIPVRIGIADVGLTDLDGTPLASMLDRNGREEGDALESTDDDDNAYVDDVLGAGPRREGDGYDYLDDRIQGNGQLNVCLNPLGVTELSGDQAWLADHGPMVGSLASGATLVPLTEWVSLKLPRLVFFRLAARDCDRLKIDNFANGDLNRALEYLLATRDSDVVNVSFKMQSDGNTRSLFQTVDASLKNSSDMLVVAAGNGNGNLDQQEVCPACLGNPALGARYGASELHRRVLAVGSAEPTLRVSPDSNFGAQTVRFYAPGTASGLDYRGGTVTDPADTGVGGSTSFAAPRATFAVALLKSFGIERWGSVIARLTAASWPLAANDGSLRFDAPVIDLTKVAAVQYDLIEANIVKNGSLYRHSYVGAIEGKLADIAICEGSPFPRQNFQSIRLGPVSASGTRRVIADRYRVGQSFPAPHTSAHCRSSGDIALVDLDGVRRQLPLSTVNSILLKWIP